MQMKDIIHKKRTGLALSEEELRFFVEAYRDGFVPDYQASALCMAICFQGMNDDETTALTLAMADSGDKNDLSSISGVKVDKHSTGGVGDKTTLVVAPLVAACGVPVAKLSGRGLGYTGGTLDKLESIPGYRIALPVDEFFRNVNDIGIALVGQTANLAPVDKKLYALRDVTDTVESLPLIASSIMSKKLASGADAIVLDVKCGSGAFMKTEETAKALAEIMVAIGNQAGRKCVAIISNMDRPLGLAIGNSLEVIEAIETMKGRGPEDFRELCLELSANMLFLAGKGNLEECRALAKETMDSGAALEKFRQLCEKQGGDSSVIDDYSNFPQAKYSKKIFAKESAFISSMETEACGNAAMILGAGRATKEDSIDHAAGILLAVKPGAYVEAGQLLATLYSNKAETLETAAEMLSSAIHRAKEKPEEKALIFGRIEK